MSKPNGRVPIEPEKPKGPPPHPPVKPPEKAEKKPEKAAPPEPHPSATTPSVPPTGPDTLKSQMPTGEAGVRNPPGFTRASESGGTSKAEDTSRAAGYVADLTKANDAPPGPPVGKTPENFAGQTGAAPTPGKRPAKPTPNTTPPTPPVPPNPPPTTRTRPASK